MSDIILPNEWSARPYQNELFRYMFEGGLNDKRAACVWHRRAGKDSSSLNFAAVAAHQRVGTIWHMLPTLNQAKKVVWKGIDKHGRRMIDQAFPKETRASTNESDMAIEFKNGSIWQCVGSDNYDSLVGTNPIGVIFSEYSVADPTAWDYIRPILLENGGWAVFIYTPRGKNHGHKLAMMAKTNPKWFYSSLTVDDTTDSEGNRVITEEMIKEERASDMDESMIQQEYYCSWQAAVKGAYYGKLIEEAEKADRITEVPWDPAQPVETWWDIGVRDNTSIWFVQRTRHVCKVIDFYMSSGVGLNHYAKILKEKPYTYSRHVGPHDMKVKEFSTGVTRVQTAAKLGITFTVAPKLSISEGIDAVRNLLPICYFDAKKCKRGIEALSMYRTDYDAASQTFKPTPIHDWTSHPADAFRTGAVVPPMIDQFSKPIDYKQSLRYVV
jgi:phage terminase large subunit